MPRTIPKMHRAHDLSASSRSCALIWNLGNRDVCLASLGKHISNERKIVESTKSMRLSRDSASCLNHELSAYLRPRRGRISRAWQNDGEAIIRNKNRSAEGTSSKSQRNRAKERLRLAIATEVRAHRSGAKLH